MPADGSLVLKVCFVSTARYIRPLDATSAKKFQMMNSLQDSVVIGFSNGLRPRVFTEHARFYLLPQLALPVLRYIELLILGQILVFWVIVRHGVRVVVAQSPYEGFI